MHELIRFLPLSPIQGSVEPEETTKALRLEHQCGGGSNQRPERREKQWRAFVHTISYATETSLIERTYCVASAAPLDNTVCVDSLIYELHRYILETIALKLQDNGLASSHKVRCLFPRPDAPLWLMVGDHGI